MYELSKFTMRGELFMRYKCRSCNYIYDPELGIPQYTISPGIEFEDLPTFWACPVCGSNKDFFEPLLNSNN